jgi:hypothetical protein
MTESINPGDHLDLSSDPPTRPATAQGAPSTLRDRRFVGIHFVCCDVYTRVYINRDETAYTGNCPRCAKRVTIRIGPGGTDTRFFYAS